MDDNRTVIVVGIITFFLGLLIGFGGSGDDKKKDINLKELLIQAADEIDSLEKERDRLAGEIKQDNEGLTKEIENLKAEIEAKNKEKESLNKEILELKTQLTHAHSALQSEKDKSLETGPLQSRISELEKENVELKGVIDKINSMTKNEPAPIPSQIDKGNVQTSPEIKSILEAPLDEPGADTGDEAGK